MDAALETTNRYAREALNCLLAAPGTWLDEDRVNPRTLKTIEDALTRWAAAGVIERRIIGLPPWMRKVRLRPECVTDADIIRARIERVCTLIHTRDDAHAERDRIQREMMTLVSDAAATIAQPPVDDELAADDALFPLARRHADWHDANRNVYSTQELIDRELDAARARGEDTDALLHAAMALPRRRPKVTPAEHLDHRPDDGSDPLGADG